MSTSTTAHRGGRAGSSDPLGATLKITRTHWRRMLPDMFRLPALGQ